ncbi:unnamed protein product, partial [Amoebophrya sp. A120]
QVLEDVYGDPRTGVKRAATNIKFSVAAQHTHGASNGNHHQNTTLTPKNKTTTTTATTTCGHPFGLFLCWKLQLIAFCKADVKGIDKFGDIFRALRR